MDYRPYQKRILEAESWNESVRAVVDCTGELMQEINRLIGRYPKMLQPAVIAALDRLKSVYMVDVAEEEKRILLKCSREINDNLVVQSVVMRHEKGDRK